MSQQSVPPELGSDPRQWLSPLLRGIFSLEDITEVTDPLPSLRLRGRFLVDTRSAYKTLAPRLDALGWTVFLQEEQGEPVIRLVRGVVRPTPNNVWLPVLLALLTVVSVIFSYAVNVAPTLTWPGLRSVLPESIGFAAGLLGILVTHEFGHYLMSRHLGVAVTPPYLIPLPLTLFGTMGAVIRMKDLPPSRRAMLLIGAAGPLSGLLIALPVLIVGLTLSTVEPLPSTGYLAEGNSLLYYGLKYLIFGRPLPSGGEDVFLHPLAWAGWGGLLVTALNLMPAGQLDGGHIVRALLGPRSRYVIWGVMIVLAGMSLIWIGWALWVVLIFFLARTSSAPKDDLTPLGTKEAILAVLMVLILVLIFTPLPLQVVM